MGRVYTVGFGEVSVSAAQDLIEITVPSDGVIEILRAEVGQSSDYGDAAAEGAAWRLVRATGASGSGGSSATPANHLDGDASSTCTCEVNNTTLAATRTNLLHRAFNVQAGDVWIPTPRETIRVKGGHRLCVELINAPADPLTMSGYVTFEELW